MKEIKMKFELDYNLNVVAYIDGCEKPLTGEEILVYLRLLIDRDDLKGLTDPDDIAQMTDMVRKREKRLGLKHSTGDDSV